MTSRFLWISSFLMTMASCSAPSGTGPEPSPSSPKATDEIPFVAPQDSTRAKTPQTTPAATPEESLPALPTPAASPTPAALPEPPGLPEPPTPTVPSVAAPTPAPAPLSTPTPVVTSPPVVPSPTLVIPEALLLQLGHCANTSETSYEWMVRFKSAEDYAKMGVPAEQVDQRRLSARSRLQQSPFQILGSLEPLDQVTVALPKAEHELSRALELFETNDYLHIRRNCRLRPTLTPNDPDLASQWYLTTINAQSAWDLSTGSTSVQVAVLDTGVDTSHEDLQANIVPGYNVTCNLYDAPGCGTVTPIATADECRHHGTRVAGIIGGIGNNAKGIAGVGYNVQIMPVRVSNAGDCTLTLADVIEGMLWASFNGADIINLSLSGAYYPSVQDAAAIARQNGSLVVYAAGNDGADLAALCAADLGASPCAAVYQPDVLIVGATTSTDTLAGFSNYGSMVDMVAPGVDIYSTIGGDAYAGNDSGVSTDDGTSFAAPIVSGAAALLLSLRPRLTPAQLEEILMSSATDLGTTGEDDTFGAGRVDVAAALQAALDESQSSLVNVDDRRLDFLIPKGLAFIGSADQQVVDGPTSRVIAFTDQNPGLISIQIEDFTSNQITLGELPENVSVGSRSLFYMKDDTSTDFVFTNQNRTYVYFASTSNFGSLRPDQPIVSTKACGPFTEISDIHLTETSGVTSRLIVADKGANTVYSYTLHPTASTLCQNEQSLSIENPLWVRSLSGATPEAIIGYRTSRGLQVRSYNSTNWTAISATVTVSSSLTATYGKPFQDVNTNNLFLLIQNANDSVGVDYIRVYNSSLSLQTTIQTCRNPSEMKQDFQGANRFRYVLCPAVKQIRVYNSANTEIRNIWLPTIPRKMVVMSDSTYRYIGVLRYDQTFTTYRADYSTTAANFSTITNVTLTAPMIDMAMFPLSYYVMLIGSQTQNTGGPSLIQYLDLSQTVPGNAILDTFVMPKSLTHGVAQTQRVLHFVSKETDSAYTLEERANGSWKLKHYPVGDEPVQIGYRPLRLYALNRSGNSVSAINLTSDTVSSVATQTRPVAFDFDESLDFLWTINETSQSLTQIDIGRDAAESLVQHLSLGFAPRKIAYHPGTNYVYVAGGTTARALNATSLATVDTQTLPGRATDLVEISSGVWISSLSAMTASLMNGSSLTTSTFTSSPQVLASTGSLGAVGLLGSSQFATSSGLTKSSPAFTSLFANSSGLFTFNKNNRKLRYYPSSLLSATQDASYELNVPLEPTSLTSDANGDVWLLDSDRLKIQRITSDFQMEALSDLTSNRLIDLQAWNAENRIYALARDLNAVFIVDTSDDTYKVHSVCASPRELILDSTNRQLIVRCPESNSLSVLQLDAYGDFASQSIVATRQTPVAMALNTSTDRLYVVNRDSDLVQIFDATDFTQAAVTVTTSSRPTSIALNETTDVAYVFHELSENLLNISSTFTSSNANTDSFGFAYALLNSGNGNLYAFSPSRQFVYASGPTFTTGGTVLASNLSVMAPPAISTAANKVYLPLPQQDVLRIFTEGGVVTDVATGDEPVNAFVFSTTSRVYVSNFAADTLSVFSTSTNALVGTVSLPTGCGPTKATSASISGTDFILVLCENLDSVVRVNAATLAVGTSLSLSANALP